MHVRVVPTGSSSYDVSEFDNVEAIVIESADFNINLQDTGVVSNVLYVNYNNIAAVLVTPNESKAAQPDEDVQYIIKAVR